MSIILVTGIGGVVGQGILRNIIAMDMGFKLVGTNVSRVSSGNYLCDKVYEIPYAYDKDYIPSLLKICEDENVELIIPSTDYEVYYLGLNKHLFKCEVAVAPKEVSAFCLDKYSNFQAFKLHDIPFAESVLPSNYNHLFNEIVVKPREGRGSRNINVNPQNPKEFDDSYVIQEYLDGPEITTSFYVTQKGLLHGFITMKRELDSGNTIKAEVIFDYEKEMEQLLSKMISFYPFRGSCNLQARITPRGIIPFEINCRISGTNSIRGHFGFNDVEYTVQEYLLKKTPTKSIIKKGTALRVIVDIIYPEISLQEINNKNDNFFIS